MDTSTSLGNRELAVAKKRALDAAYFRKGIAVAALSSCMYALYTAFVTAGQLFGVWAGWFDAFAPSGLLAVFILPTIASGVNDVLSAVWATFFTAGQGKLDAAGHQLRQEKRLLRVAAVHQRQRHALPQDGADERCREEGQRRPGQGGFFQHIPPQ